MKKKILSGVIALALLVATGHGMQNSMKSNVDLSHLALANVEALAQGESGGNCQWRTGWSSLTGWIAICDTYGVGYVCNCGDIKYY